MENKEIKTPSAWKIGCKALVALFLVGMIIYFMVFTIEMLVDETSFNKNLADRVDACNHYYYEKEYCELRDYLMLFDLYEDTFDMYWESVDGYCDYMQYQQWQETSEADVSEAEDMAEEYRQRIIDNAENCKFKENRKQLSKYAEDI